MPYGIARICNAAMARKARFHVCVLVKRGTWRDAAARQGPATPASPPVSPPALPVLVMPAVRADDSARWFISGARIAYGTLNVNETLGLVEAELPALLKDLGLNPRGGARVAASPHKASSATTSTVGVA